MPKRLGLVKKDEDGVERQPFMGSRKAPHELKEQLEKGCKPLRGKYDVVLLPEEDENPCMCVIECKGCRGQFQTIRTRRSDSMTPPIQGCCWGSETADKQ